MEAVAVLASAALWLSVAVGGAFAQQLECKAGGFGCVANTDQSLLVNYREVAGGDEVEFEIRAAGVTLPGYVAIGFNSPDIMTGASIVQCVRTADGQSVVSLSYVGLPYNQPQIYQYASGIRDTSVTYSNNELTCSFVRLKRGGVGASTNFKDISLGQADCIVMARGGAASAISILPHTPQTRARIGCGVDFASAKPVETSTSGNTGNGDGGGGGGIQETKCMSDAFGCVAFASGLSVNYRELNNNQDVEFFIKGKPPANGYIAIGFNTEDEMSGASIIECIRYNGQANMYTAYANSETTPETPIHEDGLRDKNTSSIGSELTCHFVRSKTLPNGAPTKFRDISQANCIIMSMGDAVGTGQILQHSKTAQAGCGVDYAKTGFRFVEPEPLEPLVAAHGILMMFGWLNFISVGILSARFLKKAFRKDQQCLSKDRWFRLHQVAQTTGITCAVIAFILIFVEEGDFVSGKYKVIHAVCGICAIALGVAQPIMAFFRCAPNAENRVIFNWAHFLVGNAAYILAIVCVFLVINFGDDVPGVASNPNRFIGVLVAYLVLYVLTYIVLEVIKRRNENANKVESNGAASANTLQVSEGDVEDDERQRSMRTTIQRILLFYDTAKLVLVIILCVFLF